MMRKVTSHAAMISCEKRSVSATFTGSPLFLSTTAICM